MELLKNAKIVERDEGWAIPNSNPRTIIYTVKVELEPGGERDTYKTMDEGLDYGYEGDIEVYMAKQSGKTYIRIPKDSSDDSGGSVVASSPTDKYLKDTSDLPYRVWKDMLPFMDVQQLIKDKSYNESLNIYVLEQANELLAMIETVRKN